MIKQEVVLVSRNRCFMADTDDNENSEIIIAFCGN